MNYHSRDVHIVGSDMFIPLLLMVKFTSIVKYGKIIKIKSIVRSIRRAIRTRREQDEVPSASVGIREQSSTFICPFILSMQNECKNVRIIE